MDLSTSPLDEIRRRELLARLITRAAMPWPDASKIVIALTPIEADYLARLVRSHILWCEFLA